MHSRRLTRFLRQAICGALAAWCFGHSTPVRAAQGPVSHFVPDMVIVKFRAPIDAGLRSSPRLRAALPAGLSSARGILRRAPNPAARARGLDRIYEIHLAPGSDVRKTVARLRQLPEVEYAEPRFRYPTLEDTRVSATLATPNDPQYAVNQPYLPQIHVSSAWDVIKSEANRPLVAVVDGGTQWQHQDLLANVWTNPGEIAANGLDDDGNGYTDDLHGWDFLAGDPDPRGSATTPSNADHGTHTGGLLAAVTNNGLGIASASWNPRLMAVNASDATDGFIAYGYEGILYAVDNGARIINCSWGGTEWSDYGRDVCAYAVSQGALIVAAAGNNGDQIPVYPGAFPDVYAVVNLNVASPGTDTRHFSSCYGTWVDLSAPGTDILSSVDSGPGNSYDYETGTSMASPIAAAVACLIQAQHPTWNGLKVGEQLRVTCDNIDALNPSDWWYRLGKGKVNATRAVTETPPAVRITNATFVDTDGDGQLERGETVTVSLDLHNYHASTGTLALTLTTASTDVSIVDGSESIGAIAEDANVSRAAAFSFKVSPTATVGAQVELRVDMTATGYGDFQWLVVPVEPLVETHDINKLHASLAASGNVGWVGFPGQPGGPKGNGLEYDGSGNLLFEGGLLVGTDATHLSDALRVTSGTTSEHSDFAPGTRPAPIKLTPGPSSAQEIRMSYVDVGAPAPLGVRVSAESRAYTSPTQDDFLFLGYRITNTTGSTQTGMRVGLFFDWDIDAAHFDTNRADWDAARGMGYAWDTSDPSLPYMGILVLKGGTQTIYAAYPPTSFTDALKWEAMTGGQTTSTGPGDVANMLSTGPYTVAPGDSVTVWFALVGGHTLAELQANADQARTLWNSLVAVGDDGGAGVQMGIAHAALSPNPFAGGTRLQWLAPRAAVYDASVYDARGRRVRALGARTFAAGPASLAWDGRDDRGQPVSAGVYFLRVESGAERWIKKAVVLR